jgi:hypothetical protein
MTAISTQEWLPFAFETVAVSTSAVGLTAATYNPTGLPGAQIALVTFSGGDCRATFDGTVPTASVGHIFSSGSSLTLFGEGIRKFKAIRSGGTDGALAVTYSSFAR